MPTEPTTTPGATVSGAVAAGLFFGVIAGIVFGAIGSGFLLLSFIFVPGLFVIPLVLIFIVAAFRPAFAVGVFIGFFLSVGGQISYHLSKSAGRDFDRNELASAIAAERRDFKANGPLRLSRHTSDRCCYRWDEEILEARAIRLHVRS